MVVVAHFDPSRDTCSTASTWRHLPDSFVWPKVAQWHKRSTFFRKVYVYTKENDLCIVHECSQDGTKEWG